MTPCRMRPPNSLASRSTVSKKPSSAAPEVRSHDAYRSSGSSAFQRSTSSAGRYQPAEEIERWKGADPLERYRRFMDGRGLLDDAYAEACEQEAKEAMARLRAGVLASGPRPVEELFAWVFDGDLPQHLRRQRDEVLGGGGGEPSHG